MKKQGIAGLALAGIALFSPAHAFPEPRPVAMTPEAVSQFLQAMPSDTVIANGMQRAIAECQDCPQGVAISTYLHGLFDYYGYDLSGTMVNYVQAYDAYGEPGGMSYELDLMLQQSGVAGVMTAPLAAVENGHGDRLVAEGALTPEAVEAIETMQSTE